MISMIGILICRTTRVMLREVARLWEEAKISVFLAHGHVYRTRTRKLCYEPIENNPHLERRSHITLTMSKTTTNPTHPIDFQLSPPDLFGGRGGGYVCQHFAHGGRLPAFG